MGEGERKRILYVQTSGVDTTERLYAPFILGATAAVYFLIRGINVVKRGEAEKIRLGGLPMLREVMD